MAKLTPAKARWIIRQKERGELTTEQIARIQRVTPRRVNQLWREYRATGELPVLKKPGRPRKPITLDQIRAVLEAYHRYLLGACLLEHVLEVEFGVKMSHNKIHAVLREHGLAKREPKKARRRKWVRYERKHSMSLWHTDWKYLRVNRIRHIVGRVNYVTLSPPAIRATTRRQMGRWRGSTEQWSRN